MDLYVIGHGRGTRPTAVGLAKDAGEQLAALRRTTPDGPSLKIHRQYKLATGWDQLALRIARIELDRQPLSGDWFGVTATMATLIVDGAYRATQLSKPEHLPAPMVGANMRAIRTRVFGSTMDVFGRIAGTDASAVSRWESNEREPSYTELYRLRRFAVATGIPWDDSLLFPTDDDNDLRAA